MIAPAKIIQKVSAPQGQVLQSPARFVVVIAGRRWGKTFGALVKILLRAMQHPMSEHWYVAATYRSAKRIAWRTLRQLVPPLYVRRWDTGDLTCELKNGALIRLTGIEDPDSLRGPGLMTLAAEEFPHWKPSGEYDAEGAWEEVLRPMLSSEPGSQALFIGTPKGFNWAHKLWLRGQDRSFPDWQSFHYTTMQGAPQWFRILGRDPDILVQDLAEARRTMDPRRFAQEYEASFETLADQVYDYFDRHTHIDPTLTDVGGELLIGQDFNVNPMASVVAVRAGGQCHVLDALRVHTSNTQEVCEEITRRYVEGGADYAVKREPGQIVFCPDPSGKAQRTSAGGKTDFSIIKDHGFRVDADVAPPRVEDRINNVQANLMDAEGNVNVLIHPRAEYLITALEGQTYKTDTNIPDKAGGLDHPNDALGYMLWRRFNLFRKSATVGVVKI